MCFINSAMYLLILLLINGVFGANILYVSHMGCHSHHMWNRVLALALSKKGHNVTMVSHDDEALKPTNFHLVLLEGIYESQFGDFNIDGTQDINPISSIKAVYDFSRAICEHDFKTKGLASLINYPKDFKFDLIIFDVTLAYCLYPIIDRFNRPPVVAVTPFLLPQCLEYTFGKPLETSYTPVYSMVLTHKMSFKERLINFIVIYAEVLYRKYVAFPNELFMARQYFGKDTRPLEQIERNMTILLTNTDPNLEFPINLPPNIIPVGGLHLQPAKLLPTSLQQIMDDAKDGVIVFSLGSHLRSDQLSKSKRRVILSTFAKLPQTVVWKFEADLQDLPKNVIIQKWLPQSDLLGHPNTKLLINHGGALSTQEAMYHGVPVIAIPFFADQFANAGRLTYRNMAKIIDYKTMTEESLYKTITEMLNNPMYRNNIQTLSKRYRDRLNTPLETAVFWVEYVLRHGGAEHLNLAARDLTFFQTSNLEIFVVLILGVYLIYSIMGLLFTCFKMILKLFLKSNSKQ